MPLLERFRTLLLLSLSILCPSVLRAGTPPPWQPSSMVHVMATTAPRAASPVADSLMALSQETFPVTAAPARLVDRVAGLVGLLAALGVIGMAMVLFASPNLEIVADTAAYSFGRSLLAGLLAQLLLVPTLALLSVGLVLTVVGTILIPVAVALTGLLTALALITGLLATLYAMGESITRHRMVAGKRLSTSSYRYLFTGLCSLASLWLIWVCFGWVAMAGPLLLILAILITWLLGTVGLGAALLSRGGTREYFSGRMMGPLAITDEHLWATPRMGGVPAVKRRK